MSQPSMPPSPATQEIPVPPPAPGSVVALPELLQTSITLFAKPSSPPFGVVRGRGSLKMALIYVGAAALILGLVGWVANLGFDRYSAGLAWRPLLVVPLGVVGGFAAFVYFLSSRLGMTNQTREDFATSVALYWAPIVLGLGVLALLLGGVRLLGFTGSVIEVAQLLSLAGFSLMALRTMFNNSYEQTFRPIAYGLIINSLVASLVRWIIESL